MTDNVNILEFPKDKIVRERLPDIEEINKLKEKGLQKFADAVISDIVDNIQDCLDNYGIDVEDESFIKDFNFTNMILSASIYRSLNIEHPMHEYIDKNVQLIENTEKKDD